MQKEFVALISGGKDGIFAARDCIKNGWVLRALVNLEPIESDELDSFMFQTVGHEMLPYISEAMDIPLIRQPLIGKSKNTNDLVPDGFEEGDEISVKLS